MPQNGQSIPVVARNGQPGPSFAIDCFQESGPIAPTTKPVTIIAPQTPAMIRAQSWPEKKDRAEAGRAAGSTVSYRIVAIIIKKMRPPNISMHDAMIPQIRPALTEPR